MKKNTLLLMPIIVGLSFPATPLVQAKGNVDPTPMVKSSPAVSPTPAETLTTTPEPSDPAATTTPIPTRSISSTPTPTIEVSPAPKQIVVPPVAVVNVSPTPVPTAKPTPTATPKPTRTPTSVPVVQKVASKTYDTVIRAPLDLITHVVSPNIYETLGISRRNSVLLLVTAFLCIGTGSYLLKDSIKNKFLRRS